VHMAAKVFYRDLGWINWVETLHVAAGTAKRSWKRL
jgi:hypothetical protein